MVVAAMSSSGWVPSGQAGPELGATGGQSRVDGAARLAARLETAGLPVTPPGLPTIVVAIAWRQMASPVLLQSVRTPAGRPGLPGRAGLDGRVRPDFGLWPSVRLVEQIRALPHFRRPILGVGVAHNHRLRRPDPSAAWGGGIA